jgi:hypothetical protein
MTDAPIATIATLRQLSTLHQFGYQLAQTLALSH